MMGAVIVNVLFREIQTERCVGRTPASPCCSRSPRQPSRTCHAAAPRRPADQRCRRCRRRRRHDPAAARARRRYRGIAVRRAAPADEAKCRDLESCQAEGERRAAEAEAKAGPVRQWPAGANGLGRVATAR